VNSASAGRRRRAGLRSLNNNQEEVFIKRRSILQVDKSLKVRLTTTVGRQIARAGDQLLLEYVDQLDVPPILSRNPHQHCHFTQTYHVLFLCFSIWLTFYNAPMV